MLEIHYDANRLNIGWLFLSQGRVFVLSLKKGGIFAKDLIPGHYYTVNGKFTSHKILAERIDYIGDKKPEDKNFENKHKQLQTNFDSNFVSKTNIKFEDYNVQHNLTCVEGNLSVKNTGDSVQIIAPYILMLDKHHQFIRKRPFISNPTSPDKHLSADIVIPPSQSTILYIGRWCTTTEKYRAMQPLYMQLGGTTIIWKVE